MAVRFSDARDEPRAVEGARIVLVELWTILGRYYEALTVVGGSALPLLAGDVPDDAYLGTVDVDAVIDPIEIPEETYRTMAEELARRLYEQDPQHPFRWYRALDVRGLKVEVEIDFLAPRTERSPRGSRHERIEGHPLARRLDGAELLRDGFVEVELEATLPDGRHNRVRVRVANGGALVVLKALAMAGRDEPKDAYDIDYVLAHYAGGVEQIAAEIGAFGRADVVALARATLDERFASVDAIGPQNVAAHRRVEQKTDGGERLRALAYARVRVLLRILETRDEETRESGRSAEGTST